MKILELGSDKNSRFKNSYKIDHKSNNKDLHFDISVDVLPWNDDFFDATYSEHVIEHLYRSRADHHFNEIFRVLKTGGKYIILCPNLKAASIAYVTNNMKWFTKTNNKIKLPGDTIGEIFMRFIVSEGSDSFVQNRDGKLLGGLAHQWGWDFGQLVQIAGKSGFSEIKSDYDENVDYEIKVELTK